MRDLIELIGWVVLVVSIVVGTAVVGIRTQRHRQQECEDKGGFYFQARAGFICLKPDAVITWPKTPHQ